VGTKERQQQARMDLEAAIARLSPLPVPQLAAEVMALLKPDAPDAMARMISAPRLALEFAPDSNVLLGLADNLNRQLRQLILEALQALEHASLVCPHFEMRGIGHLGYCRPGAAWPRCGTGPSRKASGRTSRARPRADKDRRPGKRQERRSCSSPRMGCSFHPACSSDRGSAEDCRPC
jgi:hypothetical protein